MFALIGQRLPHIPSPGKIEALLRFSEDALLCSHLLNSIFIIPHPTRLGKSESTFFRSKPHPLAGKCAEHSAEDDLNYVKPDKRHHTGRKRRTDADIAKESIIQCAAGI